MSNQSVGNRVQENLTQAVASGRLPASVQERAEKLLSRLRTPVRITLLGMPAVGKSSLLNLLVGQNVLPDLPGLPTLQLLHGDTPQAVCTLADGSKANLPHVDTAEIAALSPVFVEMKMPLPALGKISVLEVVAPEDPTSMHRASQWAAKRSDVVLWCSLGFNTTEQAIWAQMPDVIKDHAFLMLTKADYLTTNDTLDQTLEAIRNIATEEFSQILPIATTDAIAARKPDGTIDKALMRSSGGGALMSAVLKQVDMGRQSAVDMADILLHQHADLLGDAPKEAAAQADEPSPEAPATESVAQERVTSQPVAPSIVAPVETTASPSQAEPEPAEPIEEAEESNVVTLHPATRDAYEHVLEYIVTQSRALLDVAAELGDKAPPQIIAKTVEYMQWLADYLNENGDDSDAALQRARDAAMDAADLVQLMQMEKRDSAAIEALSLMLQIKHELQADLAA